MLQFTPSSVITHRVDGVSCEKYIAEHIYINVYSHTCAKDEEIDLILDCYSIQSIFCENQAYMKNFANHPPLPKVFFSFVK